MGYGQYYMPGAHQCAQDTKVVLRATPSELYSCRGYIEIKPLRVYTVRVMYRRRSMRRVVLTPTTNNYSDPTLMPRIDLASYPCDTYDTNNRSGILPL